MSVLNDKKFLSFITWFLLLFALFYSATLLVIGVSAEGGYYSPFVDRYLDYVSWISESLVFGTRMLLSLFNISTYTLPNFIVRITNGTGVRIAYDCVGYGVMSFWAAFVLASAKTWKQKSLWVLFGFLLLWFINVSRISLLLLANNRNWSMPLGLDHHTWFNIFAYGAIFAMMYFFEKKGNDRNVNSNNKNIIE